MKHVSTLKIYINDYDTGNIREETDDEEEEEEEEVQWGLTRSLTQSTWYLYEEIEVGRQMMMMMREREIFYR
ncbi:hypothetical protein Pmani_034907 [Petrolisthes manimaculis]|uniref:Uncharacterized protein n=1 Tax=Petrolisthes manimaculis TaxID=1843537 RepID=A0AAE1TR34_9EUCA|nr:hypothetical protein Pmani_034907 [Petrolisthes manimaculis]